MKHRSLSSEAKSSSDDGWRVQISRWKKPPKASLPLDLSGVEAFKDNVKFVWCRVVTAAAEIFSESLRARHNRSKRWNRKRPQSMNNNKTDENMKVGAAWYIMWEYMDEKVGKMKWGERIHSGFIRMWQKPAAEQMCEKKHTEDIKYVECEKR